MRRVFIIALLLAVLGVCAIDGLSLFYAYRSAQDVAKSAAQQAIAEAVARRYASSKDADLISLQVAKGTTRIMTVWTRSVSETRLLRHIPFLKGFLSHEYTASVPF